MCTIWRIGIQLKEIKEKKEREFKRNKEKNIKNRQEIEYKNLNNKEELLHILQVEVLVKAIAEVEVEVEVKAKRNKAHQKSVRFNYDNLDNELREILEAK